MTLPIYFLQKVKDKEFKVDEEEDDADVEETIEEQEKQEKDTEVKQEIDELMAEGESYKSLWTFVQIA